MNARPAVLLMLWLPVVGAGAAATAAAAEPAGGAVAVSNALSLDQAVKMVEQRFQARVVKAETEKDSGHSVYVLKLLNPAGKVWTVRVDAANGALQ